MERAAAPPLPAMARPATLDRAILLNELSGLSEATMTGVAPILESGSIMATGLIAGAAEAQLCGTDRRPTKLARPISADTQAVEPTTRVPEPSSPCSNSPLPVAGNADTFCDNSATDPPTEARPVGSEENR